ncbi:hypothetical protein PENSTE_c010G03017 [Penicillium steckii]|uniref:Zn(2)-C6 fungal-type domain-containing protein n=1 Tax=Penicillium steckii TaxID=303698 RepID=A0A1V6T7Y4_9EURO|nr:hypothetical protein PENSTE_c010G03017 [Penicillium steckii]
MAGENTTTQIKLRSACNQCHFSKVRCSGEKTGCSRCLNLGYTCVYVESRVGKVQGNRARRQEPAPSEASSIASQNTNTSTVEITTSASSSISLPSTAATSPAVIEPSFPGLALDEYIVSSTEAGVTEESLHHLNDTSKSDECSLQWGFEDLPSCRIRARRQSCMAAIGTSQDYLAADIPVLRFNTLKILLLASRLMQIHFMPTDAAQSSAW